MEYFIEPSSWNIEIIKEDFRTIIPNNCTPFILYYYKKYDDINEKGEEAYLMGVYNDNKECLIFNIEINDKSKYEIVCPFTFAEINFKRLAFNEYLEEGYHNYRYDNKNEPKMLICEKYDERFLQSLAFFEDCDSDGIEFETVKLLYVETEQNSDYAKYIKYCLDYGYKHNMIAIETSLNKIYKDIYKVCNINFFFILVIYFNTKEDCYMATVYNHIINPVNEYFTYEKDYYILDANGDTIEEILDNINDIIIYKKPNTSLKYAFIKRNILIDRSEYFD